MSDPLQVRFDTARNRAEVWLRHSGYKLKTITPELPFQAGFNLSLHAGGQTFSVDVLFPRDYPVSPPRLRVSPEYRGKIPHIERDGQLCLFQNGTEFDVQNVEAVLESTFLDAVRLLGKPELSDFIDEFQSYWPQLSNNGAHSMVVLCEIQPWKKSLVAVIAKRVSCVGADRNEVFSWLKKSSIPNPGRMPTKGVLVIHLSAGLMPADYPHTLDDLLELARRHDSDVYDRLAHQVCNTQGEHLVLICFQHCNESVLGGIRFASPYLAGRPEIRSKLGKAPLLPDAVINVARATLASIPLARALTSTATHRHVHTRGGAGHSLKDATVGFVGCGSLGSHVAYLLSKAGVGAIYLMDPQVLVRGNIGRHLLGSAQVSEPKASALARHLLQQLPHLRASAHTKGWREVWETNPEVLLRCDLIISTIGHWNTEFDLTVLARRQKGFPSVLFGWLEAHAAAGHGLFVHSSMGGCLACGCNDLGTFNAAVVEPAHDVGERGVGCGDFYQRYGLAEMIPIASMISHQAIDAISGLLTESQLRSWTNSKDIFATHSLPITPQWQETVQRHPFGGGHFRPWPPAKSCRFCG